MAPVAKGAPSECHPVKILSNTQKGDYPKSTLYNRLATQRAQQSSNAFLEMNARPFTGELSHRQAGKLLFAHRLQHFQRQGLVVCACPVGGDGLLR